MKWTRVFAVLALASLTGCGYNRFQALDEQVKSSWAEVVKPPTVSLEETAVQEAEVNKPAPSIGFSPSGVVA